MPNGSQPRVIGRLLCAAAAGLALVSTGCTQQEGPSPTGPTPPGHAVTQVTVAGPAGSAKPGDTAQFQATATLSNGTSRTVTTQAAWESSDQNVATVTSGGVVTAVAAGEAEIRATYQSVTGGLRVTVASTPPAPPAPTTFSVSGTIRDAAGSTPIGGATVTVKNAPAFVLSDAKGQYRVNGMRAGTIVLRVMKAGYEAAEMAVTVAADTTADVMMRKSGG